MLFAFISVIMHLVLAYFLWVAHDNINGIKAELRAIRKWGHETERKIAGVKTDPTFKRDVMTTLSNHKDAINLLKRAVATRVEPEKHELEPF